MLDNLHNPRWQLKQQNLDLFGLSFREAALNFDAC